MTPADGSSTREGRAGAANGARLLGRAIGSPSATLSALREGELGRSARETASSPNEAFKGVVDEREDESRRRRADAADRRATLAGSEPALRSPLPRDEYGALAREGTAERRACLRRSRATGRSDPPPAATAHGARYLIGVLQECIRAIAKQ